MSRPVSALVPLTAAETAQLRFSLDTYGVAKTARSIGFKTQQPVTSARQGKPVSSRSAEMIRKWLESERSASPRAWHAYVSVGFALVGLLAGCAGTLPVLSSGLDAAKPVIAQQCPQRTAPCERVLVAYNAGISAYNLAVLAEAVGEDATQLEAQGVASLKQLWAALQDVAK